MVKRVELGPRLRPAPSGDAPSSASPTAGDSVAERGEERPDDGPPAAPAAADAPPDGRRRLGRRGQALFDRLFGAGRGTTEPRANAGRRGRANGALEGQVARGQASRGQPKARRVAECPVVAIGSGKGGTGKSFLATSLAIEAQRLGHRVVLIDCDFGLACDHLLLDVRPKHHLRHLIAGEASLEQTLVQTESGPRLLPGVTGIRQMSTLSPAQLALLGRSIGAVAEDADLVLLDCGAGLTPQLCALQAAADFVVLVAQPELAAMTDAYAVVKTLTQLRAAPKIGVVVNRVQEFAHGESTQRKLADVAQQHAGIALHALGAVEDDPQVTQKRLGQQPLVVTDPERPVCAQLRDVASALAKWCGPLRPTERETRDGFADRLADQGRIG